MDRPKVTVYLSTYNQQEYVAQALDSILMQKTTFPYEVLVADDCSTDDTQKIVLEYQKQHPDIIQTYFTNPNVGGCKKLTNCIDMGLFCGEYLAYLEGDDYWLGEDRLQTLVDFLEEHPEYSRIGHQRDVIDEQGNYLYPDMPEELLDRDFTIQDFLEGKDYSDFGSVFRNYFLEARDKYHQLFWASKNVCDFQDMFITQDFGPVYVIGKSYGTYRLHSSANASNYNSITTNQYRRIDQINICRAIEEFYDGKYDLTPCIELNQTRLVADAIQHLDPQAFAKAKECVLTDTLNRILPRILYQAWRGNKYDELKFLIQQLGKPRVVKLLPATATYVTKHVLDRLRKQKPNPLLRGYVKK